MIYSNLNLTTRNDTINLNTEDFNINILAYLPIEDKNSIIQMTLQNAEENGIYNPLKQKMYFELYLVYMYTDIQFTEDEKDDPIKLYDELASNGIIDFVIQNILPHELSLLEKMLAKTIKLKLAYRNTIASVLNNFMEDLPINAEAAQNIVANFDPEKFQSILQFVEAANGGRPINKTK